MSTIDKKQIKDTIKAMTLEEKLTVLIGSSQFKTPADEKHGIPSMYCLDGGTGANFIQMVMQAVLSLGERGLQALSSLVRILTCLVNPERLADENEEIQAMTAEIRKALEDYLPNGVLPGCFPPGIVLGASWDTDSIYECGKALAKEAGFYGIDTLLGTPNVNIHRDPLNGRLFEGYSEDPCLVASLAPAFVKGVQSEGIIANVKHFACNNQETDRRRINEHISLRALYEIYFPGFEACVREGECKTVMSAYNAINGEYCAHSRWLLTDVLRGEWGFEGFVMSDWGGAYDMVKAWNAGNDLIMPGPRPIESAVEAVKDHTLDEARIDQSLERYLNVILDSAAVKGHKYTSIDRACSAKAAYNSIREGMVLLKNDHNALPLSMSDNVCFFGEKSRKFIECGIGSANVITSESTSLFDTMAEKLGAERVTYEEIRQDTDAVVVTVGVNGSEGFDRGEMDIERADKVMLTDALSKAKKTGKKTVVILNVCGPVDVSDYVDMADAILCVFIPGMEGGHAAADALLGDINPSGKLPVTFPKRYEDCPSSINFPGRNLETWYGEGIFVGYRYFDFRNIEPMFPFGHGLSYTTFEITGARLSKNSLRAGSQEDITLTVNVKNTGDRKGKEVVQVYIGQDRPSLTKPPKELKAFKKIELMPGEETSLEFRLSERMLQSYDENSKNWVTEPDTYHVYIGNSSRNIMQTAELTVEGWNPLGITAATSLSDVYSKPGAFDKLLEYCPDGILEKGEIEVTVMFRALESLEFFWKKVVEPALDMEEAAKPAYYDKMLQELNMCR